MKSLTKQQKIALMGLSLLTILIFVIAFFQFKSTIYNPFKRRINEENKKEQLTELLNLKNVDTDEDGLNDFDELYIYKTSPYLQDTDSDGIFDNEEIEDQTDPLCPKGKICGSEPSKSKEISEDENLSVEEIKNFLIESGIDKEMLNNVDDKTLIEVYNETIKETGIDPNNFLFEENFNNILSESDQQEILENLSAQDIRNLLIQEGVEKEVLDQINDDDLKAILLQFLQKQNQN